jgi:cytochrome oxidase Cu insertion factor (SCO1/SenC/PrrC family)
MVEQKKSQGPLIIMLSVAIFPMIAAYFIFFTGVGMPEKTVNAGLLINKATSIKAILNDSEWKAIEENKLWRVLLPISNNCDDTCKQNLYTTRQVHIRLDQKSKRVKRMGIAIETLNQETRQWLEKEHPRLTLITPEKAAAEQWYASIPELGTKNDDFYFLVDQEGRAMMLYSSDTHGNDVLKDIKRALKYSIDYQ